MKKLIKFLPLLLIFAISLSSCKKDNNKIKISTLNSTEWEDKLGKEYAKYFGIIENTFLEKFEVIFNFKFSEKTCTIKTSVILKMQGTEELKESKSSDPMNYKYDANTGVIIICGENADCKDGDKGYVKGNKMIFENIQIKDSTSIRIELTKKE